MQDTFPQEWVSSELGEVCLKVTDGSHNPPKGTEQGLPMLSAKNVQNGQIDFSHTHRLIPEDSFEAENARTQISEGDVLLTIVGALGRSAIVSAGLGRFTVQRSVAVLSAPELDARYFRYQLESPAFQAQVLENAKGTAQKGIYLKKLKGLSLRVAPLAEQKAIAEKLDTLLAQVEITKARLHRLQQILKQFRQSVLTAAVSGKLTEEWRGEVGSYQASQLTGNEKFKEELFEAAKSTLPELPDLWEVVPAGQVLDYVTSGSRGWSKYYSDSGALFLRMSNVRYDTTKLDLEDLQYVDLPGSVEGKRSLVQQDDLLVSITADVGRVARIEMGIPEAYVNQHLALVRPSSSINSEYLATCIAARNVGIKQVSELKRGATKAGLGLDDIRSLAIPVPSLEEQAEIVDRVEEFFGYADTIENQVNKALDRINNLTQSILAKAFRGELTAEWRKQNPSLITGENSAEALLDKIKVEREEAKKQAKSRKPSKRKPRRKAMSKEIIDVVDALKAAKKPLSGQELLAAAGYPSDSSTEQLEAFFLDIRKALKNEMIVKQMRDEQGQDWFEIANR